MGSITQKHAYKSVITSKVIGFIKKNAVMLIALLAAIVTCFFVPVDKEYLGYFDYKTLVCLFCVLAVVCALKNVNFFYMLAQKIVLVFKTTRSSILALVYVTFIGSMLIANDMALLTFLPLGYFVLTTTDNKKHMPFTFIMQTLAANLGGMLTPFGNPQNLYLYTKFNIPTLEFMSIMLVPFLVAVGLITLCCFIFVRSEPLSLPKETARTDVKRTVIYLILFALSVIIVFKVVHYLIGLAVILVTLLIMDRKALLNVDYCLLFTFVFFFIFAGNMSRIGVVKNAFSALLEKDTLLVSALSCQVISNVPSAILLSQFTANYADLLVGVNIGGVGTLISSLASLITFREYTSHEPDKAGSYILKFSAFNFSFLIILLTVCHFV